MQANVSVRLIPGKGDGVLSIGMQIKDIRDILGEPAAIYPNPEKWDPEVHDSFYFRYTNLGLDLEFDRSRAKSGELPRNSKLKAIHYKSKALRDNEGHRLTHGAILAEYGMPDSVGEYPQGKNPSGTWEFYNVGLQANYDHLKRLLRVIVCPCRK